MLYAWIGFLKPGADQIPPSLQEAATDFLRQPLISILAAGPLRDASGTRAGMMMIFEHDSRDAAEKLVANSPFLRGGLYEDHRLYEFDNEIG